MEEEDVELERVLYFVFEVNISKHVVVEILS